MERNGHRIARVLTPGCIVEVPVDHMPHLHLGDLVRVSSGKKGNAVTPVSEADLAGKPARKQHVTH